MLIRSLFAALILTVCSSLAEAPAQTPTPMLNASLSPAASPEQALKPEEKKPLLGQFKKTLSEEERILDRQERTSIKDFSASQAQQLKDWRNQEKRARRAYFEHHSSGPERRDYVQGYIARKKQFDQRQKDDLSRFKGSLKEKHDAAKTLQKARELQFKSALDKNVRPDRSLWLNQSP
jgi:hypothetical protein